MYGALVVIKISVFYPGNKSTVCVCFVSCPLPLSVQVAEDKKF